MKYLIIIDPRLNELKLQFIKFYNFFYGYTKYNNIRHFN